jgi:hypothetical protein
VAGGGDPGGGATADLFARAVELFAQVVEQMADGQSGAAPSSARALAGAW